MEFGSMSNKETNVQKHHLKEHQKNRSLYRFMWDEFSGACCVLVPSICVNPPTQGITSPNIHQVHQPDPSKNNQGLQNSIGYWWRMFLPVYLDVVDGRNPANPLILRKSNVSSSYIRGGAIIFPSRIKSTIAKVPHVCLLLAKTCSFLAAK